MEPDRPLGAIDAVWPRLRVRTPEAGLWMAVGGPLVVAAGLLLAGYFRGPTLDASVFMVVAEQIRAGGMPYVDAWDHKPPGIYLVEVAASFVIPAGPWTRAWLLTLVATLAALAIVAFLLRPRSRPAAGVALLATTPVVAAHVFAQGGGYTESIALFPSVAALALAADERLSVRGAVGVGLLLAMATAVSLHAVAAVVAVSYLLVRGHSGRTNLLAASLAGLVVAVLVAAWLWFGGALGEAIDQVVAYNRHYVENAGLLRPGVLYSMTIAGVAAFPLLLGALVRVAGVRSERASALEVAASIWVAIWSLFIVAQGNFFGHYAIVVAPPLAILAAGGAERLLRTAARARTLITASIALAFVPATLMVVYSEALTTRPAWLDRAAQAVVDVVPPDRPIFVWGNEPSLYLRAEREPVSRYVYLLPLTAPGYGSAGRAEEVRQEWERNRPAAIVDASYNPGGVGSVPLLGPWRHLGAPIPDELDSLRDFVRANYRVAASEEDWTLFVPSDGR